MDNRAPREADSHFADRVNLPTTLCPELLMSGKIDCSHLFSQQGLASRGSANEPWHCPQQEAEEEKQESWIIHSVWQNIPEPAIKGEQPSSPQLLLLGQTSPESAFCTRVNTSISLCQSSRLQQAQTRDRLKGPPPGLCPLHHPSPRFPADRVMATLETLSTVEMSPRTKEVLKAWFPTEKVGEAHRRGQNSSFAAPV